MVDAVEQVRQRLIRAATALRRAGVPYTVIGGNAVAARVATVNDAGLIDSSWTKRLPPVLAARLQTLLDTPDG